MTRAIVQSIFSEIGTNIGIPDLALDDSDHLGIVTDDGVGVNFEYFEDDDVLVIYSTIGEVPEEHRLRFYEELLHANFLWQATAGATLSLAPRGNLVMLNASVTVHDLDRAKLLKVTDHFAKLSWAWSDRLQAIVDGTVEDDETEGPQESAAPDPSQMA